MGKIYKNGILFAGSTGNADSVAFNNEGTSLEATNVQGAIKEINNDVADINNNLEWKLVKEIIGISNNIYNINFSKYKEILVKFTHTSDSNNAIRNFTIYIPVICLTNDLLNYSTGCYQNDTTNNAFFNIKISLNEIMFPNYSAYYLSNNVGTTSVVKVYAK